LPLALYSELETPGGEPAAGRLALLSIALGTAGLLLAEWLARALRRTLGS
jgi:molybdate transport system permease protein